MRSRLTLQAIAGPIAALFLVISASSAAADSWDLQRLIAHSQSNNPDAALAEQRAGAAASKLAQAEAAFWPKAALHSGYVRGDSPLTAFAGIINQQAFEPNLNFNSIPAADNFNLQGLITLPVFTAGRLEAARQAAAAEGAAAKLSSQAVRAALGLETARAFFTIQKTAEFSAAAAAAVASFEENLRIAKRRLSQETILKAELLDVEVGLAKAEELLIQARNSHALARESLRALLGFEDQQLDLSTAAVVILEPETGARRLELQAAEHVNAAAQAAVEGAESGYWPQISAFASADYNRGWLFANEAAGGYSVGAALEWTLWDGHLNRAKVKEAQSALRGTAETIRKIKLAVGLEQKQARLRLNEAKQRKTVAAKARTLAEESAKLTRVRFEQGLALSSQLIDSETALTAARVAEAEARAHQQIALCTLRWALGLPIISVPARTDSH